ncbi:DNA-binding barrel domain superfamily [Sesbania bispinosa]|nr:DNA-binding barrel domain superfamily [Sesbania bispinosa]
MSKVFQFRSKINPSQALIMIEPTFWEKVKGDIPQNCVLIDPAENTFPVLVVDNGDSVAFVKGVDEICRIYRLEETHNVVCTYFGDDEFKIQILNGDNMVVKCPDIINNGVHLEFSDTDSIQDLGPFLLWRVNLSKAAASGINVMPIPARLVTSLLDGNQSYVDIIDEDSNLTSCKLLRPKRRKTERYIAGSWCQFIRGKNLKEGDVLGFYSANNMKSLHGKIGISENFWTKWYSHLPSEVYFIDPVGNSFPIGISSKGDSAIFERNVNTMISFYGLNRKHSGLFCYMGGNQFYIRLGNRYGVEINYPQKPIEYPKDFPFWIFTMTKSSASGKNALPIPAHFVREGLLESQRELTLRLSNGEQILCKISKGSRRKDERYLCSGWYKFCRNNNFKEGDMLLFYSKGDAYNLCVRIKRS